MSMISSKLGPAPEGWAWVSLSKMEDGVPVFRAMSDGKARVDVKGHVCYLSPVSDAAVKAFFNDQPERKLYDPTQDKVIIFRKAASAAAKVARHEAESRRGANRVWGEKTGKVLTDLDEVQARFMGKVTLTHEDVEHMTVEQLKAALYATGRVK